jgi:hypothetical protein
VGILHDVFGPSKAEVWSRLAEQIGGDFEGGGLFQRSVVRADAGGWTVTLDTYSANKTVYTRLRAPYVNADAFRFQVYRSNMLWDVAKLFGVQDVEVGHFEFDRDFVIRGTDESRLRQLFDDLAIRQLLAGQRDVCFTVQDDEGFFGTRFPQGVDELRFVARGTVRDLQRLRNLFDLFAATLDRLTRMGSAYRQDPGVRI